MSLESAIFIAALSEDKLLPELSKSSNYKHWVTKIDKSVAMYAK